MSTLVPSNRHHQQDLEGLRLQVEEREQLLVVRRTEVTRSRAALDAFRIRYRQQVGLLHDQLDELELALAEAELGEISKRIDEKRAAGLEESEEPAALESAPKLTSDAVRKLFRDVAKAIHPDLAQDADARDKRHSLMIEANRAYALGDEEQLRAILDAWERSPEAVQGSDAVAMRMRLERRIAQIDEQLELFEADLASMKETSLWKLKAMVDDKAATGQDLITDMVRRLRRDILVAQNRLDALRPPA